MRREPKSTKTNINVISALIVAMTLSNIKAKIVKSNRDHLPADNDDSALTMSIFKCNFERVNCCGLSCGRLMLAIMSHSIHAIIFHFFLTYNQLSCLCQLMEFLFWQIMTENRDYVHCKSPKIQWFQKLPQQKCEIVE